MSLATSYYSDVPAEHAAITGRPSYARTRANIAEAVRRGDPAAGRGDRHGRGQRSAAAQAELVNLGIPAVGYDQLRQVGRGIRDQQASTRQLCGRCGDGVAAISPDGAVWPCVFSRWLPMGNVLQAGLAEILEGPDARRIRGDLVEAFTERTASSPPVAKCEPKCAPKGSPCYPGLQPSVPADLRAAVQPELRPDDVQAALMLAEVLQPLTRVTSPRVDRAGLDRRHRRPPGVVVDAVRQGHGRGRRRRDG